MTVVVSATGTAGHRRGEISRAFDFGPDDDVQASPGAARTEWVLLLDEGWRPGSQLLERFFDAPVADRCGAMTGEAAPDPSGGPLAAYASARVTDVARRLGLAPALMVRRSALRDVGGIAGDLRFGAGADLCRRLEQAGWSVTHRPGATVVRDRPTLKQVLEEAAAQGTAGAWLRRNHPSHRTARALAFGTGAPRGRARAVLAAACAVAGRAGALRSNARGEAASAGGESRLPLLVLVDEYPQLSETFVVNEVRTLRALGHRVRVEAGRRPLRRDPRAPADVPVAYLADDAALTRLAGLVRLAASHPARCFEDVLRRRRWRREEDVPPLRALAAAHARLRRGGERHLHAHFAAGAALTALRIGRVTGIPYSVTAHAYDIYRHPRNLREKLVSAAFATSGCDYTVRHLRKLVGPGSAERIHEVVMGVDPATFRRRAQHPAGRSVLAVGRLVEKKGFADLVRAAALVELDRMRVIGEGPLRAQLEELVERLGLVEVVELAGARDPDGVREAMEEADVLAMPCVVAADGDRDSMPVVVKEALAMELPVVATNEVGLPEVVAEDCGRLVPPGDPAALAAALDEVLSLPVQRRAAMGRAGRARVEAAFDLRAHTQRLSELIEGAAGRGRPVVRDG